MVLDFGKPILLTDVIIPGCLDLASLSLDVWVESEEADGERLVLMTDPSVKTLVLNDLSPPVRCRYVKVRPQSARALQIRQGTRRQPTTVLFG